MLYKNCNGLRINLQKGSTGANINIFSDSQAALKAICALTCSSKLVWECILQIYGNYGNEKTDELARKGAGKTFTGPVPFSCLPESHFKMALRGWEDRNKALSWSNTPGLRHS